MDSPQGEIISFMFLFTLAIVSPGPNFVLVVERSLRGPRREGLWTALGVALGSACFGLLGLLGVIPLLNGVEGFDVVLRVLGGFYLLGLGGVFLYGVARQHLPLPVAIVVPAPVPRPGAGLLLQGLLTNLTNPKAWLFYLTLFTVVLSPGLPTVLKIILGLAIFTISLLWYSLVAILVSSRAWQRSLARFQGYVQGVLALALIGFGLQVLLG